MNETTISETLKKGEKLVISPTGKSMLPMLRQKKDIVVISPYKRKLKVNDVVLYLYPSGKYVLHRLVKIKKSGYVFRGDSVMKPEYGVTEEMILGTLDGFYRGDTYIDCEKNKLYRLYVFYTRSSYPIRYIFRIFLRILSKIKRTFFKKTSKS